VRLGELLAEATAILAEAHVPSPRVDAELLAAHVLGVPRGRLAVAPDPDPDQERTFRQLVARRAAREPVQHLTGEAPFRYEILQVGPGVFIPRPETEQLVMWGLSWLRAQGIDQPRVVDLCAGSGAIAISIATEKSGATVLAVEQSESALPWLHRNVAAARPAPGSRVVVVPGDATDPAVLVELDGTVDLVLSNPPYVPRLDRPTLPPEVAEHDPPEALFAGPDGLDVIRALIPRIATLLRPGGAFAMEHDETHVHVVPALVAADGRFEQVETHEDLARRPRFTSAVRAVSPATVAD
jgi:protein-(glutamine-N5) methyltransferase, release factor-specific